MDHSHHDHHGHAPAMPTASTTNASSLAETIVPRQEHDHGGGTGDNSTTAVHNMMMNMAFHTGYSETILFDFWKTSDTWGMLGSAVFIFFIAFAYEALKFYREHLYRSSFRAIQYNTVTVPVENGGAVKETHKTVQVKMFSGVHSLQTILHVVQTIISYFLMLIFMTYNVWLCLAVALGAGIGYFFFGWKKSLVVDITEHCH